MPVLVTPVHHSPFFFCPLRFFLSSSWSSFGQITLVFVFQTIMLTPFLLISLLSSSLYSCVNQRQGRRPRGSSYGPRRVSPHGPVTLYHTPPADANVDRAGDASSAPSSCMGLGLSRPAAVMRPAILGRRRLCLCGLIQTPGTKEEQQLLECSTFFAYGRRRAEGLRDGSAWILTPYPCWRLGCPPGPLWRPWYIREQGDWVVHVHAVRTVVRGVCITGECWCAGGRYAGSP